MGGGQSFGDTSTQGQYGQGGAGMGAQGMAGAQMSPSDRRRAQQIQQQLQDQFPDANINVTASQGTVTLWGTVSDNTQKQQAEQVAQSFSGVQNVQNNLTVGQQGFGATGRQSGSYPPQGYIPGQQGTSDQYSQGTSRDQMGSQPGFGGTSDQSQFGRGAQQGATSASDLALARQVAQKLQQQLSGIRVVQVMRPGTIYVMATQGTITLHGFVQDGNIKQQAGAIARNIRGVRNVENTLNISAAGSFTPSYGYLPGQDQPTQQGTRGREPYTQTGVALKAYGSNSDDISKATKIGQTLRRQLPNADITVIVSGNRATLWGTVPNAQDKQQAQQIASSVSGIRDIQNNLTVSGRGATAQGTTGGQQAAQTQFVADTDETSGMSDTSASAADMALAHQVANKLQQQLSGTAKVQVAAPNTIYVTASQGTVSLTGWITDQNIKRQAEQVAKSVSGVRNVRNLLGIGLDTGSFPPLGYTPSQESEFGDQQFDEDQYDDSQSESQDSDFPPSEDPDSGSY
jgi:osmotically-inducible protein OsmY